MVTKEKKDIIRTLFKIGSIKFGKFKLKSGLTSPFYFDLRPIVSYPDLLQKFVAELCNSAEKLNFDYVTGIPYTALPIASLVSAKLNIPLVYIRKEQKTYGTRKKIEGNFKQNQTVLVIDDLITTGSSINETIEEFNVSGLNVNDVSVIIDRSKNRSNFAKKNDIILHSLIKLDDIITVLYNDGEISDKQVTLIKEFNEYKPENQSPFYPDENFITKRLKKLINYKKSNLTVSIDKTNQKDFFKILEKVSDDIVMVKTHVDMLNDYDKDFTRKLKQLSNERNFIIFEDRKFADIGNTVYHQYEHGIYNISKWAETVTIHAIAGQGTIDGIFKDKPKNRSSFLLAKMSSKNNLMSSTYTNEVIKLGEQNQQWVSGFIGHANTENALISLKKIIPENFLLLTPGVNLHKNNDNLGQQYISAKTAIMGGSDIIIVGRGICENLNPREAAKEYKEQAWEAYIQRESKLN